MQLLFAFLLLIPAFIHSIVLEHEVLRDLDLIGIDVGFAMPEPGQPLDVAIIGGGQAGMSLCIALQKNGIYNIQIFDRAPQGSEGPWATTARMKTLRSDKHCPGPALDFPVLTFQSWVEASYGDWKSLAKAPTDRWAEYLRWYRTVLQLPVENGWELLHILPHDNWLKLVFNEGREVLARKVVLATGRDGCGGFEIPDFVYTLPKSHWFHTGELIDPAIFHNKRVCIIGASASAFDAMATAAEQGALTVDMLIRRKELPIKTPFTGYIYWGAFFHLSDKKRAQFFENAWKVGNPPPPESIERIAHYPNCLLHYETWVEEAVFDGALQIRTNKGVHSFDLLILATGYAIDLHAVPELSTLAPHILLWGDRMDNLAPKLARFPYLGSCFQFLEKRTGDAPYLKDIHCFNYGAFLSHGRIAGDIDQLPIGIERLADGIAIDLCIQSD